MFERKKGGQQKKSVFLHAKKYSYSFISAIFIVLVIVLLLNVLLIYNMTVSQIETIGQNQMKSITRNLDSMLSQAEYMTSILAEQVEERMEQGASREEMSSFFTAQSSLQNDLSDGICMNAFLVRDDYIILPGYDLPDDFNVTERIWYAETLQLNPGDIYISPPYVDMVTGEMCFTVSQLLSDKRSIVALDFTLARIQNSIEEMQGEASSEALIVNAEGMIIGYADEDVLGKRISDALPEYEQVYREVISRETDQVSLDSTVRGKKNKVLFTKTQNNWYLILSVREWELYKESYLQLIRNSLLNLLLIVIVVLLYIGAQNDRMRAEKALSVKEDFLSSLSSELKAPLNRILSSSNRKTLHMSTDLGENMDRIQESALQLSGMMDNLFSYSGLAKKDGETKEKRSKSGTAAESHIGKRTRLQVTVVLIAAMFLVLFFCDKMLTDLGRTRMSEEAIGYNSKLIEWMGDRKAILDMFCYSIAAEPELLEDRSQAEAYMNAVAENYPEISLVYIGNPDAAWKVIMNNGWVADDTYILQAYPWYADTMSDSDGFFISSPYYDTQEDRYYVTFSERVYGKDGSFLGVFAIDFKLDKLTEVMENTYSEDGYAFLISDNGIIINHPNEAYELSGRGSVNVQKLNYNKAYSQNSQVHVLKDYDGAYKACISEHDDFSNFTIMVVKDWWIIYGGIVFYKVAFVLLFGVCIFAVGHLIRKLLIWQQEVNVRLKDAADEAVQATQAKSQFLAQMSHEIRTPINAVLGMNEMILRESDDEDICEYSENIQSAGKTLLALINSILDFSKIEDGKMEIIPVQYDTLNLISDLVNMISDKAEKKDLLLEWQIDERLPYTLYGDDVRIRQIIVNLLTNAVKYTKEGKVTLVIQKQDVADAPEDTMLHVEVIDTGIGIRKEDMGKLFESFQRLDEEKNHNVEGTGLGISIVQSLLKMMGSTLQVESEYGKGSRFYFDLKQRIVDDTPIGDSAIQKHAIQKEEQGYLYAPEAEILIVDDNEMNLKVASGLLKRSCVKIDTALSGMECIRMVEKKQYDIIFMDHMMPEMDGIETMKALKKGGSLPAATKIIVMTANAIAGAKDQYLEAGFDDYLSKPVAVDALEKTLVEYLPEGKAGFKEKERKKTVAHEKSVHQAEEQEVAEPQSAAPQVIEFTEPSLDPGDDSFTQEELQLFAAEIPELDVKTGLLYCADSKFFYVEMLNEFTAGKKDEELSEFLQKADWENYRITVHALKSNAKTIGAMELSEEARLQEMAAKELRTEDVAADHGALAEHYKELKNNIRKVLGEIGIS
ncbi:MAG: cache domain-containing protein [Lachnospiraceae bacterium]|nr:cache domain-containing protein [bacterium]MDY5517739.1 cache domain-containing protein [Lachnospiraceae bacterium]